MLIVVYFTCDFLKYLPVYSTFSKLAFHSEHSRPVLLDLFYIYLRRNCQNKYEVRQCFNEVCIFALYRIFLSLEYSTCWQSGAICVCINTWHSHHSCVCVHFLALPLSVFLYMSSCMWVAPLRENGSWFGSWEMKRNYSDPSSIQR